jgi:hypothetical protein
MLQAFKEGSPEQQQSTLNRFLRMCVPDAETANMYLYNCGTFWVRFFVNDEDRALMVLTLEVSGSPDEPNGREPSNLN